MMVGHIVTTPTNTTLKLTTPTSNKCLISQVSVPQVVSGSTRVVTPIVDLCTREGHCTSGRVELRERERERERERGGKREGGKRERERGGGKRERERGGGVGSEERKLNSNSVLVHTT